MSQASGPYQCVGEARSAQRKPNAVDAHVGERLRLRRKLLGLSQEELASRLGLALQQVQKYENGVNRVSASRLYQLCGVLEVPVAWFFEEMPGAPPPERATQPGLDTGGAAARDLFEVYARIEDETLRRSLVQIAKAFAAIGDS